MAGCGSRRAQGIQPERRGRGDGAPGAGRGIGEARTAAAAGAGQSHIAMKMVRMARALRAGTMHDVRAMTSTRSDGTLPKIRTT
jgi:hypothetical protein